MKRLYNATTFIQKNWKRWYLRRWYKSFKAGTIFIQRFWRAYSLRYLIYKPVILQEIKSKKAFNFDDLSKKENADVYR